MKIWLFQDVKVEAIGLFVGESCPPGPGSSNDCQIRWGSTEDDDLDCHVLLRITISTSLDRPETVEADRLVGCSLRGAARRATLASCNASDSQAEEYELRRIGKQHYILNCHKKAVGKALSA